MHLLETCQRNELLSPRSHFACQTCTITNLPAFVFPLVSHNRMHPAYKTNHLSDILKAKTRGNEAYGKHQYSTATAEYSRALSYFFYSSNPMSVSETDEKPAPLMRSLLSNRSASYHHEQKYDKALADAKEVVKLAPNWHKVCALSYHTTRPAAYDIMISA